jgi:hypothetical protein
MKTLKILLMMCLYILVINSYAATIIMKLSDDSGYVGKLKMTIGATAHSDKEVTTIYDEHFQYEDVVIQETAPAKFDFVFNRSSGLSSYSFDSPLFLYSHYFKAFGEISYYESYVWSEFENYGNLSSPSNLQTKSLPFIGLFIADVNLISDVVSWQGRAEVLGSVPLPAAFWFMFSGTLTLLGALRKTGIR